MANGFLLREFRSTLPFLRSGLLMRDGIFLQLGMIRLGIQSRRSSVDA